jgi:TfoX/Sxy family transcriptional regulator of competence genes
MAYDEGLAARLRARLGPQVSERRMFGGLVFLRDGAIAGGVYGPDLLVRVEPGDEAAVLARPGVRQFLMGERAMRRFVLVAAEHLDDWF